MDRLTLVFVLPTPPLPLVTAMTRARPWFFRTNSRRFCACSAKVVLTIHDELRHGTAGHGQNVVGHVLAHAEITQRQAGLGRQAEQLPVAARFVQLRKE